MKKPDPRPARGGASPATTPDPFWRDRRGLELSSAYLLPGRRELEVVFRSGHAYRVEVTSLGAEGGIGFATIGEDRRTVVLGLLDGETVDVPSTAVLALAEPAYRAAVTRRAESIGERIRALRLAAGRTAADVAGAAGMARSNYARLEAGTHEPRLATLRRVAGVLRVPLDALLG